MLSGIAVTLFLPSIHAVPGFAMAPKRTPEC